MHYGFDDESTGGRLSNVRDLFSRHQKPLIGVAVALFVLVAALAVSGKKETDVLPADDETESTLPPEDVSGDSIPDSISDFPDPESMTAIPFANEAAPDPTALPAGAWAAVQSGTPILPALRASVGLPENAPALPEGASFTEAVADVWEAPSGNGFLGVWEYRYRFPGTAAVEGAAHLASFASTGFTAAGTEPAKVTLLGGPETVELTGTTHRFGPVTPGGVSWTITLFDHPAEGKVLATAKSVEALFALSDPTRIGLASRWAANVPRPAGSRVTGVRLAVNFSLQDGVIGAAAVYIKAPADQYEAVVAAARAGTVPISGAVTIIADEPAYMFGSIQATDPFYGPDGSQITFNIYPPIAGEDFRMDYAGFELG